jgi:KaiC/GvpD/RAD55 family RecA-like ATPase
MAKNKDDMERVPTGIKGLDDSMEGGLIKNSVNIIGGSPGTGKSIFAMQYLVNGIKRYNEPGVYITIEEKKDQLMRYMSKFGWDLESLEKEGKVSIFELSPSSDYNARSFSELKNKLIKKNKAKRIVFDSLTAYFLLYENDHNKRESSLSLFETLREWDCTSLLIEEYMDEQHKSSFFDFQADAIIWLYNMKKTDTRVRAIEIYKMRGSKHLNKLFPLEITDKGIVIYPEQSVF